MTMSLQEAVEWVKKRGYVRNVYAPDGRPAWWNRVIDVLCWRDTGEVVRVQGTLLHGWEKVEPKPSAWHVCADCGEYQAWGDHVRCSVCSAKSQDEISCHDCGGPADPVCDWQCANGAIIHLCHKCLRGWDAGKKPKPQVEEWSIEFDEPTVMLVALPPGVTNRIPVKNLDPDQRLGKLHCRLIDFKYEKDGTVFYSRDTAALWNKKYKNFSSIESIFGPVPHDMDRCDLASPVAARMLRGD